MEVKHLRGNVTHKIDGMVFNYLCENFCLIESPIFQKAKERGYITLNELSELSRIASLPYMIFFASHDRVKRLVEEQNKELFGVLDKKYIMGTRGEPIDVRWIRRIVLDLSRKQKIYSKYRKTGKLDKIIGRLKTSKRAIREQADYVLEQAGIDIVEFRQQSSKGAALKYLREQLALSNIHTSIEARNYMPQSIPEKIKSIFSGMYIRDPRNPYIFICNELSGSPDLGSGRKIYTLVYLLVCIFKDISYAVSIDRDTYSIDKTKFKKLAQVHDIVNEILMPLAEVKQDSEVLNYDDLEKLSRKYQVTPKAVLQRLYDTRVIADYEKYKKLSDECARHFAATVQKNKGKQSGSPGADVMVAYYQGDFLDFVRSHVPAKDRTAILRQHVTFNRLNYGKIIHD